MSTPRPPADDHALRVVYQPGAGDVGIVGDGGAVAEVYVFQREDEPHALALAYQMAAAPLLFEALRQFVGPTGHTAICTLYACSARCQQTRAALAAATIPAEEEAP